MENVLELEQICYDVPLGIVVGQRYDSFEEFDTFLNEATKAAQVRLYRRNSRTIDAAAKRINRHVNPDLKFVHLKYACIYGGKKFKSKAKGVRVKPTLKGNLCDAHLTLKLSSSGNELEVSDVSNLHNHQVPLPSNTNEESENKHDLSIKCRSCLTDQEEDLVDLFSNLGENKKLAAFCLDIGENKNLADILENTTLAKVSETDGLPRFICRYCARIIVDFHKFKVVFQENETYLRDLLKNCIKPTSTDQFDNNSDPASDCEALDSFNCDIIKVDDIIKLECEDSPPDNDEHSVTDEVTVTKRGKKKHVPLNSEVNNKVKKIARHICKLCMQGYGQRVRIRAHLSKKHNINSDYEEHYTRVIVKKEPNAKLEDTNEKLACKGCNEKFETKEELQTHLKTHRDFICEECGAAFNKKSYLRDHMEVHEKVYKFICPYCGKAFKRRGPFGKHKKIHTHPGHAVCDACGQRFNSTSCLRTHFLLKHVRSRNHRCEVCGKSFSLKATLQKHHSRKHAGERERSFKCDVCDMAYKDKSTLNRHVKMKHDKTYTKPTCDICKKEYSETVNLSRHMARHHRNEPIDHEPRDVLCGRKM